MKKNKQKSRDAGKNTGQKIAGIFNSSFSTSSEDRRRRRYQKAVERRRQQRVKRREMLLAARGSREAAGQEVRRPSDQTTPSRRSHQSNRQRRRLRQRWARQRSTVNRQILNSVVRAVSLKSGTSDYETRLALLHDSQRATVEETSCSGREDSTSGQPEIGRAHV